MKYCKQYKLPATYLDCMDCEEKSCREIKQFKEGRKVGNFFDLHRHDQFSLFDGYGKAIECAERAKELGYNALGTSNHGSISGLVQHWQACNQVGIKPVLGCEVYFQPKYNKTNPERKSYHLCLFVKNLQGYENLCHMLSEANKEQFYYKPIIDMKLLRKYHKGLICSTACVASVFSQAILNGHTNTAEKMFDVFKGLFGSDFYVEIQPYKIDKEQTQETVNRVLMKIARQKKVKCILTSDSHFVRKEHFDTYCKMHEIGHTTLDVKNTYSERYMPSEYEICERFSVLHKHDFKDAMKVAEMFVDNMKQIYDSVEADILGQLELNLPKIDTGDKTSQQMLRKMCQKGLRRLGKNSQKYIKRCKEELDVIHYHGFDDYFLMVQDYVNWAKESGIEVGAGRGSACNCMVANAIGITDVDSIKYKLDFSRFMRKEKKKMPDIDVDFETSERQKVIDYVVNKFEGKAVQICSYGEYGVDNLVNDLAKVCGLPTDKEVEETDARENKKIISEIKTYIKGFETDGEIDFDSLSKHEQTKEYNKIYDNIIKHFIRMNGKVRYLGKHAAGVAVVGTDISDYCCIVHRGNGLFTSCYDLNDLEHINCIKFDMLGLKTLSELKELRRITGHQFTEDDIEDEIFEWFREGKTDGVFQMEKGTPKKILDSIQCDCMEDVIAVNALNRPAPLQLKMHETYAQNKTSDNVDRTTPYYELTKETYGTILYQEQTVEVAQKIGHLTAEQSFDMLKIMKKVDNLKKPEYIPIIEKMCNDFMKGCKNEGLTKQQAEDLWKSMLIYGFNKGHSTGYSLISVSQMWYKIHFPSVFWYVKIRYAQNDSDVYKYCQCAVRDGGVVFLPHVNQTAKTSIRKVDGELVIQQGLSTVKGIGEKAAEFIEEERKSGGDFKGYDDFYDRCKGRTVTQRVIDILEECGALEFNEKKYIKRVIAYNSMMLARSV